MHPPELKLDRENGTLFRKRSQFQSIVLRAEHGYLVLFLDGHIQFHSYDEHRYHESLGVIPFLYSAEGSLKRVLICGGGDGLLARELLKFKEVERVLLVDIDPDMTELARREPVSILNERSLFDPRVEVRNQDAAMLVAETNETFDLIISDFPDPIAPPLNLLYGKDFYAVVRRRLRKKGGILIVQSLYLPATFACIHHNIRSAFGEYVYPYRTVVQTMVMAGFNIATDEPIRRQRAVPEHTRFLNERIAPSLFAFGKDEMHYIATSMAADACQCFKWDVRLFERVMDEEYRDW